MSYQPNFSDPRVVKRINSALEFVENYLNAYNPKWQSTRQIDKFFGQGQLDLSKWLRQKLLVVFDNHFNYQTGKCKTYLKNPDGVKEVKQYLMGLAVKPSITPQQQQQLDTGEFEYDLKANRLFNWLQMKPKRIKVPLLSTNGYIHNYDIKSAAPRLILQYARKCGLDKPTPVLDLYLNDRNQVRSDLANQLSINTDQVKELINALLNGAVISHDPTSAIFNLMNRNHKLIDDLKANQMIQDLKEEFRLIWSSIKPHRPVRTVTLKDGTTRKARLSSRDKSEIYRELELEVLKSVMRYLKKTKNKKLLEHDGWTCMNAIDLNELMIYVRTHTGYDIELDWKIYDETAY